MSNEKKPFSEYKVLLVDDDDITREDLQNDLVSIGFTGELHSISSVKQALKIVQSVPLDLIISDLVMPEITGMEFLKMLKKDPKYKNIPFIFLTANNDRSIIIESLKLGVKQFILKPWTKQSLMLKISDCLNS